MGTRNGSARTGSGKLTGDTGDVISIRNIGDNSAIAAGRGANASIAKNSFNDNSLNEWKEEIKKAIDTNSSLSNADKADVHEQVEKITAEATKGQKADLSRLEKLVNTLGVMAPDIFDVALATIGNPLAGLGLVAKKIGEKAKFELKS